MLSWKNQRIFWDNWHDKSKDQETLTTGEPERLCGKYAKATIVVLLRHVSIETLSTSTILDYGCGTGRLTKLLAPLCRKLICGDISAKMLETCRERLHEFSNVEFLQIDPENKLPLGDSEVDIALSYAALGYFGIANDFWRTMSEIDRVAKQFCLQLHSSVNEYPDSALTIEQSPFQDIRKISCYRPSIESIKNQYKERHYLIEQHEPDIRGLDNFFYKINRSPLLTYLEYGLPAEQQYFPFLHGTRVDKANKNGSSVLRHILGRVFFFLPDPIKMKMKKLIYKQK